MHKATVLEEKEKPLFSVYLYVKHFQEHTLHNMIQIALRECHIKSLLNPQNKTIKISNGEFTRHKEF